MAPNISRAQPARVRSAPRPILPGVDERVLAERLITYDTSQPEGLRRRRRLRQGLARVPRGRGRAASITTACRSSWPTSGRGDAPDGRSSTATSTSSPAREGSSAARRGRPPHRPRRLRHEGRARGDDVRARDAPARTASACASCASPTRSPRTSTRRSTDALVGRGPAGRLRHHRRADRPPHRRPGQGRAGDPRRSPRDRRPRLDAVARATTRSSRRSTSSAASRRCPSAASPPTSSTARRSTSRGSRAATPSTRSPTSARWTSTSATCPTRTPARSSPRSAAIGDLEIVRYVHRAPAIVSRRNPYVLRAARRGRPLDRGRGAVAWGATAPRTRSRSSRPASRPSSSGPVGGGHHGPDEWVSIASLTRYREALRDFVRRPARVARPARGAAAARHRGRPGVRLPFRTAPAERPPHLGARCSPAPPWARC